MKENSIKKILEESNFNKPVIVRTKYGFTKFWKEDDIKHLSWGKNWNEKHPVSIDLDSAVDFVSNSISFMCM